MHLVPQELQAELWTQTARVSVLPRSSRPRRCCAHYADPDRDKAYFVLILTSGDITRYYPFRKGQATKR